SPSPIRDALKARHSKRLDDTDLLRILAEHGSWRVPAESVEGQHRLLVQEHAGERWLQIFTDGEAMAQHLEAIGHAGELAWVETTGEWLLSNLADDLTGLAINPTLPEGIRFLAEHFPSLRSWGRALTVEAALIERRDDEATVGLLSESAFLIAFIPSDGGAPQIALAPDPEGRQLAALFTAPDTARTFTEAAGKALGRQLTLQSVLGGELFANLGRMPLDGLVFNCLGPSNPVAVTLAFTEAFSTNPG
ncbi:MAG: hypothetical protein ACI8RZ_007723, partial [Myxococcota bacterium]